MGRSNFSVEMTAQFVPFIVYYCAGGIKQKEMCSVYFKNVICL